MKTKHLLWPLLLLSMTVTALPALSIEADSPLLKHNNPFNNGATPTMQVNGKSYTIKAGNANPVATRTPEEQESIIYNPNGNEKLYNKDSAGTYVFFGEMELYEDTFPSSVVWGDNDEVYVKDFLSTYTTDSFIKGKKTGNEIVFDCYQLIDYVIEDPYEYGVAVGVYKIEIDEVKDTYEFKFDPSITQFSITVDKNGKLQLVIPGKPFNGKDVPEYTIGIYATDDGMFLGFSDFYQVYNPTDYETTRIPFGVETEQYVFIDEFDFASFVDVAYTDSYIYLKGLDPMVPEGVVKARIEGNKAYIAQNQYVGIYLGLNYIFTKIWYDNPDYDENDYNSPPYFMADPSVEFELTFNREEGWIASENPGVYLSFQPDQNSLANANCMIGSFTMRYQNTLAGTPSNPTHLYYLYKDNLVAYYGYADFQFNISNYSVEGTLLDENYLLYRVFVNGEPLVFRNEIVTSITGYPVEAYPGVPMPTYWIPYLFNNAEDISKWSSNQFDVGIYEPNVKTLGVQTLYVLPDHPATYSDIVTLDVETGEVTTSNTGVEQVTAAPVERTEYYDLSGRKVKNLEKGVYILKNIHSDGKVTTSKVMIR